MSISNVLHIGTQGMRANQAGVHTASQNMANANTPGYARQRVSMHAYGVGKHGLGVMVEGSSRVVDGPLEQRFLGAQAFEGKTGSLTSSISILDLVFAEGAGSVGNAMDRFHEAIADLTSNPDEAAVRHAILSRGESLVQAFARSSREISNAISDTNTRIQDEVGQVNEYLSEIASLGRQIVQAEAHGSEASDLRDRRDQLVRDVSSYLPVHTVEQANGQIDMFLGGSVRLVSSDGEFVPLQTEVDADTGNVSVFHTSAGAEHSVDDLISSGRIGGYLEARDEVLSEAQSRLDQLAFDLAAAYNAAHSVGAGLDGVQGRNFFEPLVEVDGAAASLAISEDVLDNPDAIAAAEDPAWVPGDNRNALSMLDVESHDVAQGGTMTLQVSYGDLVAFVGTEINSAQNNSEFASASLDQVMALRDSVSGVSTDEEMVSLMQYQRGFQASMKLIQTADEMLQDLLQMKR